ncbi:MAG TPA: thioesterase family protein [Novosphingobium sp.]|nr:thioesterase family protein [Novosphingobium sp.]
MPFSTTAKVRFADVDPAGIVFYPRYFEMLNGAVEDWFAADLGADFRKLHLVDRIGTPTVKLEVQFLSPSELGDELTITIAVREVGRSSCAITVLFSGEGRDRLRADVVLVCMDLDAQKSRPWPEAVRAAMLAEVVVG